MIIKFNNLIYKAILYFKLNLNSSIEIYFIIKELIEQRHVFIEALVLDSLIMTIPFTVHCNIVKLENK